MYKKTLDEIKTLTNTHSWEGYIWMVENRDSKKLELEPEVYNGEVINWSNINPENKPYNRIQEANLYCDKTKQSIHIKNIDGLEYCFLYDLNEIANNEILEIEEEELIVPGAKAKLNKLNFKQLNQLTKSPISGEEFTTWQPVCKIFVGFSK